VLQAAVASLGLGYRLAFIPTLLFGYGADIKTAGTASLLISLPTVLTGVVRYIGQGALRERTDVTHTVAPMGIGSILGAIVGGLLVGVIAPAILKLLLGVILLVSAIRTFHHVRQRAASPQT
jgi:uncharacterized membrane protein YfcA